MLKFTFNAENEVLHFLLVIIIIIYVHKRILIWILNKCPSWPKKIFGPHFEKHLENFHYWMKRPDPESKTSSGVQPDEYLTSCLANANGSISILRGVFSRSSAKENPRGQVFFVFQKLAKMLSLAPAPSQLMQCGDCQWEKTQGRSTGSVCLKISLNQSALLEKSQQPVGWKMRWEELSPKACEDAQSKRIGLYPALPSNEKQPLFMIATNQPLMKGLWLIL